MDALTDLFLNYGYWGMLVAAFLAGSFFPFSSEAVMLGFYAMGLHVWPLIIYGTIGNVLGSMFNYCVGRMGKLEWIENRLHIKKENMDKAQRFMQGKGAWVGFFAFIPFIGSAITILLGYTRANVWKSLLSIFIGKFGRYLVLMGSVGMAFGM